MFTLAADFTPLRETLTFTEGGRLCVNIDIETRDALENVEKFSVVLTAHDERIEIKLYYATVYIIEDGGQLTMLATFYLPLS